MPINQTTMTVASDVSGPRYRACPGCPIYQALRARQVPIDMSVPDDSRISERRLVVLPAC